MVCSKHFFVIGAPKCGTTALCHYLSEHPDVCFSRPKEPNFFCYDFPAIQKVRTPQEYSNCFNHCKGTEKVIGEGSIWYLYSEEAIPRIIDQYDKPKFIVMVRNPVDAAISLYTQKLASLHEDQPTFEQAWFSQNTRRKGNSIPKSCLVPSQLLYKDVFLYGQQIERLYRIAPKHSCKVLFFDDLVSDPKSLYFRVLKFLSLPSDNRQNFPNINKGYRVRFKTLAHFARCPPSWLKVTSNYFKYFMKKGSLGLASKINAWNSLPVSKPFVPDKLKKDINKSFYGDVCKLEKLTGRDLSSWK
jgi:hypothetical protein